jgi:hypothetical protein
MSRTYYVLVIYKVLVSVHVCHTGSQLLLFMALYKVLVSVHVCHTGSQLLLFMALYKVLALTCAWSKSDRQPTTNIRALQFIPAPTSPWLVRKLFLLPNKRMLLAIICTIYVFICT